MAPQLPTIRFFDEEKHLPQPSVPAEPQPHEALQRLELDSDGDSEAGDCNTHNMGFTDNKNPNKNQPKPARNPVETNKNPQQTSKLGRN